jgi:anti-sigma factor RsiW
MKNHWHEDIQQYLNGQANAEEASALQAALGEDAELRALYLDYINLDVALAAAAEAATITENGMDGIAPVPRSAAKTSPHYWR